jgi:hypothetical protein
VLRQEFHAECHSDATLPISRLGTGSTDGSNIGRGWGLDVAIIDKKNVLIVMITGLRVSNTRVH